MMMPAVELRRSTVCEGWGVFAIRDIAKGECVTAYAGTLVDNDTWHGNADYALKLGDTWTLVGESDPSKLSPDGIAQMANDAIHLEISGRRNNCDFLVEGTSAYLRTTRHVHEGEEMLVDYHFSYWLARSSSKNLAKETRTWLRCHKRVISALKPLGCTVDMYMCQDTARGGWDDDGHHGVFVYVTSEQSDIPCACPPVHQRRRRRKINVHLYAQDSGVPLMLVACAKCDDV